MNLDSLRKFFDSAAGRQVLAEAQTEGMTDETCDREQLISERVKLWQQGCEISKTNGAKRATAKAKLDKAREILKAVERDCGATEIECNAAQRASDDKLKANADELQQRFPDHVTAALERLNAEVDRLRPLDLDASERAHYRRLFDMRGELRHESLWELPIMELDAVVRRIDKAISRQEEMATV